MAVNETGGVSPRPASVVVIAREGATTEVKGAGVDVPEASGGATWSVGLACGCLGAPAAKARVTQRPRNTKTRHKNLAIQA